VQAMILAAGFGTRLLPHTRIKPKPLFPILNQPLLLLTIRRLQRFGFSRIIVNCHHLRTQVEAALAGIEGVVIQSEETILGTGGGLRRALAQLEDEPLLVTNGDIYHTIDYAALMESHGNNECAVTMAMHDHRRFNKVPVSGDRIQSFDETRPGQKLAYTGLQVVHPAVLESIADGEKSCIISHYRQLLQSGIEIGVFRADNCFWTDMGTPADYLELHAGLLTGKVPRWRDFDYQEKDGFLVSDKATITGENRLEGWCALGAVALDNATLSRTVVWDGVALPKGHSAEDQLISVSPVQPAVHGSSDSVASEEF